jgi:hypothetical protein
MGWHSLIETDPNDDLEFYSDKWHIERKKSGQFCPQSKIILEKEMDSIYLMALKSELLDYDLKYGLPYYIFIPLVHDNTIPSTPQLRKIECTLIQSTNPKHYKKSLCHKEGRTVHDEIDASFPSIFEYVPKEECHACNPRLDCSTNKLIFGRVCPVPGCDHTYGLKKGKEEQYHADVNSHDCLRENSSHMADYAPPTLPIVEAVVYKTGILTLNISTNTKSNFPLSGNQRSKDVTITANLTSMRERTQKLNEKLMAELTQRNAILLTQDKKKEQIPVTPPRVHTNSRVFAKKKPSVPVPAPVPSAPVEVIIDDNDL